MWDRESSVCRGLLDASKPPLLHLALPPRRPPLLPSAMQCHEGRSVQLVSVWRSRAFPRSHKLQLSARHGGLYRQDLLSRAFSDAKAMLLMLLSTSARLACVRSTLSLTGVPVLSEDDCECSPGYGYSAATMSCALCEQGGYKAGRIHVHPVIFV